MAKKIVFLIIAALGILQSAWAQGSLSGVQRFFVAGNELYQNGKFDEAVQVYEKIRSAGYESGPVYYNIANSYFKEGKLGKAVLNYERARFFIPNDSDVKSNYAFAREQLNLPAPSVHGMRLLRWNDRLWSGAGVNVLTILVSVWYVLIFVFLSAGFFLRQQAAARVVRWLLAFCVVMAAVSAVALKRRIRYIECGAVVTAKSDVKFAPLENGTTYFTLDEGRVVEVEESNGRYVKIRRADGKTGWAPGENIELITR